MKDRPRFLFIRSLVGWWTGTGWSRLVANAQNQLTEYEAKTKQADMRRLDGHRCRIYALHRREVPLNDKQILLGDDSVRIGKR